MTSQTETSRQGGPGAGSAAAATPAPVRQDGASGVDAYRERLTGETRSTLEALQRSLASVEAGLFEAPVIPEGFELRYGYRIGGIGLLHDPALGVQITTAPGVFALPNTQPWCLGLANLRGNLIPVYDLAPLLEVTPPRRRNKLLVVGGEQESAGVLIDDTPAQIQVDTRHSPASDTKAPAFLRPHLRRVWTLDGEVWLDIDYGSLFAQLHDQAAT